MKGTRRAFADELYAHNHKHDEALSDRLLRFRSVEPPTAELLGVLLRAINAQEILELGTSSGYSTIWLADAADATDGMIVSVDTDAARTELARSNLQQAGLLERVTLRTEDAGETLRASVDGQWDFIFLDAERPEYVSYIPHLVRTLSHCGILAVDNVLSHERELVEFTRSIEAEPGLTQTVVPVGAGLRVAVRL